MATRKVSELQGAALDWAVAKQQHSNGEISLSSNGYVIVGYDRRGTFTPSTNWAQGGPIIEREGITWDGQAATLCRHVAGRYPKWTEYGPTPLIAAMRCYVASKLGDEVEIPDELL